MIAALLGLQALTLVVVLVSWLRREGTATRTTPDPRLAALLTADLPAQIASLDARTGARLEALERLLRSELTALHQGGLQTAERTREAQEGHAVALRQELLGGFQKLGQTLHSGLAAFRGDHREAAETLRDVLDAQLTGLSQRLSGFAADAHRQQAQAHEVLHTRLSELRDHQAGHQERLRGTVEARLDKLNELNAAKLEEMRATVDEKLHATLHSRLNESFGTVTEQLARVHTGLGEMSKLSADVGDLSRIFTNVKSRGGFAEVQLGMLLEQMLAPNQFLRNATIKPHSGEMVEYAVKLPTPQGELLLPVDAKFPREAWERLEDAYAAGDHATLASAGRVFEAAIRTEARRICDKYIAQPVTTSFAIMFLPTEGLYAEVMRREGLQAEIQQRCRVTLAGPSTLSAVLNSFQMGFHMLHLQQKGDEVWRVLARAKEEFGRFESLMGSMERQVGTVQNTIEKLNTRTRAINKTLREVSVEENGSAPPVQDARDLPSGEQMLAALAAAERGIG